MTAEINFYRDLAYVFAAAVMGGAMARALRQPMILGYVLGGVLVGPFTPGPTVSDIHHFEALAEIGVILLMYSIGLEFSFDDLLRVKWIAILGSPLGIALSVAIGLGVGRLLDGAGNRVSQWARRSRSPAPWCSHASLRNAESSTLNLGR
jgi:monovalent cation:H+ antiporter-2, CPA2 family